MNVVRLNQRNCGDTEHLSAGLFHSGLTADAAHVILNRPARECTGHFFIDDSVLAEAGVRDFARYSVEPGAVLLGDLFVDRTSPAPPGVEIEFMS